MFISVVAEVNEKPMWMSCRKLTLKPTLSFTHGVGSSLCYTHTHTHTQARVNAHTMYTVMEQPYISLSMIITKLCVKQIMNHGHCKYKPFIHYRSFPVLFRKKLMQMAHILVSTSIPRRDIKSKSCDEM